MSKADENLKGQYAGFVSRLIAFAIDIAIIIFTLLVMSWLINVALRLFGIDATIDMDTMLKVAWSGVITLIYAASYFVFFWTLAGQTPGKTLMGLRIVTSDGHYISLGRSVRRLLGYLVSILAMWIGFLWILLDNRRQGWHDKMAGTFVIYSWDARSASFLADWYDQKQEERRQSGPDQAGSES